MMRRLVEMVREFRTKHGLPCPMRPTRKPIDATPKLTDALDMVMEEYGELVNAVALVAIGKGTLANVAKELADCHYALTGLGVKLGIPMPEVLEAVHGSNMTKPLRPNGVGKIPKGDAYEPPDIAAILRKVG